MIKKKTEITKLMQYACSNRTNAEYILVGVFFFSRRTHLHATVCRFDVLRQ